jgi:aminoglycoside phosphotransferase (APT) family kinase protein
MSIREASGFVDEPDDDFELSLDLVESVLREQFPRLARRSTQFLESGWSYDAYLVDESLVFRFPRHAGVARDLDRQERVLAFVHSAIGAYVGIPKSVLRGAPSKRFPYHFTAHEYIAGDQAWGLDTRELADDIGRALTRIHSVDVSAAESIGVRAATDTCRSVFEQLRREVCGVPAMEAAVPGPYRWLAAGPVVPNEPDGPPRLIHGDLLPRHLIVNRGNGRLAGIIDWAPVLGDPALDFSYLVFCGPLSFVRLAVDAYELPMDAAFLERTIFLARMLTLAWVAGSIRDDWGPTPYMRFLRNAFEEDQ